MPYPKIMYIAFIIFLGYFVILTLYYVFLGIIGIFDVRRRVKEEEGEDYRSFYLTSFTMPVSIIIPAHNEEEWISDSVKSVLNLNYPAFEIIVVDDGSTDKTLEILQSLLDLGPIELSYPKHYKDGNVRSVLKSSKHPNVTVISKFKGLKKAGAVNAGLNLARNDYICVMDADTILEPNALIKVMARLQENPDNIIGAGSYFGLANGLNIKDGRVTEKTFSYKPIIAYQNLEYMRSLIGNRIAWSRFNAMPNVAGGFGIWRRDILYELGGYSSDFTCEDIELTFRAQDYAFRNKDKGYRIIMLPYYAGWTEGPSNVRSLISQRERWQRVINETVWTYFYMTFNPRCGAFGYLTMPYFIMYEVLGVFFEIASVTFVTIGWLRGMLEVRTYLAFLALMVLSQFIISLLSIFSFILSQRMIKPRYAAYLIFLSAFEMFWYRPLISFAKLVGTFKYLLRVRSYEQYKREARK